MALGVNCCDCSMATIGARPVRGEWTHPHKYRVSNPKMKIYDIRFMTTSQASRDLSLWVLKLYEPALFYNVRVKIKKLALPH